ncbi:uncharacterized protein [Ptychodera flava]|uniref:uncharacterized protein n=1 Tax=Ptychodera flava TaxID=63121 RepID=UPI00396A613B
MDAERQRLAEDRERTHNWKRWGPFLSERQWGTVREDYSADGSCWDYFPHDHARSRAYRWGEDGLLGITDRQCRLCFALALWNGKDSILKERLFGLTGPQGNHGEDCKENYYYLDSSPSHSYMKALYKYPQNEYPYSLLEEENRRRGIQAPEYELEDTGVFSENKYWDVYAEYAKNTPNDVLCKVTVANRGPDAATIHVLPQLWFRNTWIWGCTHEGCTLKPNMRLQKDGSVRCQHESLGKYIYVVDDSPDGTKPPLLFTENETNTVKLYETENYTPYVRDAFHRYVVNDEKDAVNPKAHGTKVAPHYILHVPAGESVTIRQRFFDKAEDPAEPYFGPKFEEIFEMRKKETDEYYETIFKKNYNPEEKNVVRQCYASLLWSKQFYHYIVKDWLSGDKEQPEPPQDRKFGRNIDWKHLFNRDVISMPDKWEYPWYASWDLAFHMIPMARIDPQFAKDQLLLFLREWYLAPNGQMPAYEFEFGDVNPPVHAWSVFRVFKMVAPRGQRDRLFLARCFQKLMLNFTWWINRKDPEGKNIFSGGFLGLDNIGVFDRSKPLPTGGTLEQADGTAWVAFFCVGMLDIALELAISDPSYEDMASKFFEHFVSIVDAMNQFAGGGGLWDEEDGFYYDVLRTDHQTIPLRIRSMVGLVPLYAVLVLDEGKLARLEGFLKRTRWFLKYRQDLASKIAYMSKDGVKGRLLLAIPSRERLKRLLRYVLDENEFLSEYGIRSVSKVHKDHPFVMHVGGEEYRVNYVPGESNTYLFGGNSNWRGPIWLCVNYLIIEALERYDYFYGEEFQVEYPTGSGKYMRLSCVAQELALRLTKLFLPDENGRRPCHGENMKYRDDPHWKDLVLFYEYFHGDSGRGCGASHQTGWTAVVANCFERCANRRERLATEEGGASGSK